MRIFRGQFLRLSGHRLSGGGGGGPTWTIPKTQMWHPQIPDRHYYGEHPTYNGFVLWIRGLRPYLEKMLGDTFNTSKKIALFFYSPTSNFVKAHNPDLRLQLVALFSFFTTSGFITYYINQYYQHLVDITNLVELGAAKDMDNEGFWLSQSEDFEKRTQDYAQDHSELTKLWDEAFCEATTCRDFNILVNHLNVNPEKIPEGVPLPISFRFNMIPYGKDNPDTQTFPTPSHEKPMRAFALNFTYNNLSGDWGDYINRQDNKSAVFRPARNLFADVYIPGTK